MIKKITTSIFTVSVLLMTAGGICSCKMNSLGESAGTSVKLSTDFYYMKVTGDVGFEQFIAQGGASSADEMAEFISNYLSAGPFGKLNTKISTGDIACSAIRVNSPDNASLVGRNFDWDNCKTMIVYNIPGDGAYSSLSTVNLDFLGFGDDFTPTGMINGFKATAAVYVPMDGINEKGLVVSDLMAGDKEVTDQKGDGLHLTTTGAIRYLLNYAADTEEALELLANCNMHSDIAAAHHLFISDAKGQSVCVEWVDGKLVSTPSPMLNNHYLCEEKKGVGSGELSLEHEAKLLEGLEKSNGVMDEEELADLMFEVVALPDASFYGGTQWTVVFDSKNCSATWYWHRDRAKPYRYEL
ncbi:MAG: linear amide C-N hydrolase [Candidatus Cryptobacteroides sp.]